MIRKMTFVLAATVALGAAALAPTSASAWPKGPGNWGGHHSGWGAFGVGVGVGLVGSAIAYDSCIRHRVFDTPYGPVVRRVNVCY